MTTLLERFLRYTKIDTQSQHDAETYPSTAKQLNLARLLEKELRELGMSDVELDQYGYVTATLPANIEHDCPVVGFIAHMDTSPDASGENVKARVIENYDGLDIVLNEAENIILSPDVFPDLLKYKGERLVVTDGTTLLGADDKAGIAAIMDAMRYLIANPDIKHGRIRVGFTPDEEVGAGVEYFDVQKFGADFAYTIDGGEKGELEWESFNAASARLKFKGISVHPGTAKGVMRNANLVAMEFQSLMPLFDRPEHTEKREGFIHLTQMSGLTEAAQLDYIIRDHDKTLFEAKKQIVRDAAAYLQGKYGQDVLELEIKDQYFNMGEVLKEHPEVLELARQAYRAEGIEPIEIPIRGGTDGSRLSFMGLPTPNVFYGGHNGHGPLEYLSVTGLKKSRDVIVKIAELVAKQQTR
ncbi:MAG: peptidase T [Chloroflexi bacterium]|jgi:tripeptide aminopeptidase|nr:peptidase T [Chloroflexota bacterium]